MLVLVARIARALSSTPGAITASMKVATIARGGVLVDRPVEADDAAERRQRVGVARPHVGFGNRRAGGGAARVGVLDHRGRRLVELQHDARGGVEVEEVRERQLLALQHRRRPEPRGRSTARTTPPAGAGSRRSAGRAACARRPRDGRARAPAEPGSRRNSSPVTVTSASVDGDRRVVGAGVRERAARQFEPERRASGPASRSSSASTDG